MSQEKPEECNGCGYETNELTFYEPRPLSRTEGGKWLCNLCEATYMGNAVDYPSQYPDAYVMQTVIYCTHLILDAIKGLSHDQGAD